MPYLFHIHTGYAFLLFKEESSVHKLLFSCSQEGDKRFIFIPTSAISRKKVRKKTFYYKRISKAWVECISMCVLILGECM